MKLIERVELLEKEMGMVKQSVMTLTQQMTMVGNRLSQPDPMMQMIAQKSIGIEQSVASMGKTMGAMAEELTETGVLDGTAVMVRIRRTEDDNAKNQVLNLKKEEIIEESDEVGERSLVVISQEVENSKTETTTVISEYNLIGMNSPAVNQVWKGVLLGKKVGETVKGIENSDETEILTVKEIYELSEKNVEGEGEAQLDSEVDEAEHSDGMVDNQEGQEDAIEYGDSEELFAEEGTQTEQGV